MRLKWIISLTCRKATDDCKDYFGAGNYKHGKLEFVASNLTFAVVKQIAHFFAEQFKLIATMVEIIDNQPHSYTYYIIFSLFDLWNYLLPSQLLGYPPTNQTMQHPSFKNTALIRSNSTNCFTHDHRFSFQLLIISSNCKNYTFFQI